MANFIVKIILSNNEEAEYGITDGTVSPRNLPSEYNSQEWVLVNKVLTDWITLILSAGFKKVEIERE